MGFQLKISKGSGAGKVFTFADKEARIGRTPENDVIVKDGGVSRNHARVYFKGGRHFLEDLGSSNGTRLNGTTIAGPKELKAGDTLTIGDVTFVFDSGGAAASSRKSSPKGKAVPAAGEEAAGEDSGAGADEGGSEAAEEEAPSAPPPAKGSGRALAVRPPARRAALAQDADEASVFSSSRRSVVVARDGEESVVEKARRRREASRSPVGRVLYVYSELPWVGKIAVLLVIGLLGVGAIAGVIHALRSEKPITRGPEPEKLGGGKVADSFGYGPGVSWVRPDMKLFSFELTLATRAVAVLRYQAADISQDEVVIMLNGVDQGSVPPDTLDSEAREIELVLRPVDVKQRGQNSVMFDNTKNPPGKEPWKIWNLGLEIVPIPEVPPEELVLLAEKDAQKAKEFYDLRDVGPDNLFKAWKTYRNAWLTLEGLNQKPELYDLVRAQMRIITPELDRRCRMKLLEALQLIQHKKRKKARQVLDDISRYFPTREHRCQSLAHEKINEYDL